MASNEPLISFDLIEEHKENIQQLPGGRSAKSLHAVLSPLSSRNTATREETQTLNSALKNAYEEELQNIDEADDPLDCYCRYVKWTLNTYPSAQATTESGLRELLERATKAFITSNDYKNDPRYLKLWLQYIQLFSDAPNEIFRFLARHSIGEHLALYYEEFAAWLEGVGRWSQADEVYRLGIEREARPTERLMRKYSQFQQRFDARPQDDNEPSSPAIPKVRAALAAKVDPFAPSAREDSHQAQRQPPASNNAKPKKAKMAIFSDADGESTPVASTGSKGWDSIGSMKERRKENTIEARPWAGETLKAGKKVGSTTKMEVFKDPNQSRRSSKPAMPATVNPKTGRPERAFVDMDAVYAQDGEEYSFEELRAMKRGWMQRDWRQQIQQSAQKTKKSKSPNSIHKSEELGAVENLTDTFEDKLDLTENSSQSQDVTKESKPSKQKKMKLREVKQEAQTIKAHLDSPSKPKLRKKSSRSVEPTMTINTKAAHNDAYDMFNNAEREQPRDDTQSGAETDYEDDTFSASGDTGRISTTNSEFGDDTMPSLGLDDTSASPWSEFTENKSVQKLLNKAKAKVKQGQASREEISSQDQTQDDFDTQAIAALANQDFGELDTVAIAKIAGGHMPLSEDEDDAAGERDNLQTPLEPSPPQSDTVETQEKPRYIPLPPEDYNPTSLRPYRDPNIVAQNKLPFMTPIVERTESSLAPSTAYPDQDWVETKTPSKCLHVGSPSKSLQIEDMLLESPPKRKQEAADNELVNGSTPKKLFKDVSGGEKVEMLSPKRVTNAQAAPATVPKQGADNIPTAVSKPARPTSRLHKGPLINDLQCNPCDQAIRDQILEIVVPDSYTGFHNHMSTTFANFSQVKAYNDKLQRQKSGKSSPRKGQPDKVITKLVPPMLKFPGSSRVYAVKRELGKGAFAPVYLVDSVDETSDGQNTESVRDAARSSVEAIKAESPPSTLTWEFHILQILKSRLGIGARAMESIVRDHECHLFQDECYLVLDYHSQGTVLDLVNLVRSENIRAGKAAEGLEEPVVMWLSVELLRCMQEIHKVGVLHGDLKADNCLVRMNQDIDVTSPYNRHGDNGWNSRGLTLIDFGRGIDMKAFKPEARFVADWDAEETDCAEIREARPWKFEIDLFGAAGIIHSLLFGKYIETVVAGGGGLGQKKEWRLREPFKRYWEKDIWTEVFAVLINGGGKKEDEVKRDVSRITSMMEQWLETESEKNGRDLRGSIRRCERLVGTATTNSRGKR